VRSYSESEKQRTTREQNFTYHKPIADQPDRYVIIRDAGKSLSGLLNNLCPDSRELSLAQTNLEQAIFWANAAIARNEKGSE